MLLLVYAMAGGLHEACADWRSLRDYMTRDAESQKSGVKGETGARRERGGWTVGGARKVNPSLRFPCCVRASGMTSRERESSLRDGGCRTAPAIVSDTVV